MESLQVPKQKTRCAAYLSSIHEDRSGPITILSQQSERISGLQENDDAYNTFVLNERESHGRRLRVRLDFSVYARQRSGDLGFMRLRNKHILFDVPSSEQAELIIDTVRQLCQAFEGKHLVKPE